MKKSQVLPLAVAAAALLASFGSLKIIDSHLTAISTTNPAPSESSTDDDESPATIPPPVIQGVEQRLSYGDKVLIQNEETDPQSSSTFQEAKNRGVEAMAQQDYSTAELALEEAIGIYPNAPETLIYLNNARIGDSEALTLAISVPVEDDREDGADVAKEMLRGIAQKQDEINQQGGINGKLLKVLIADDDSDEEVAKQVAQALAADSNVLGVVGHFTSDMSLAASDVYQSQGLVMISPTATSVELSKQGNYIFRSLPTDGFNATALVDYMLNDLALRNAAVFYNSDSAYSTKLSEVFKERLFVQDGRIVAEFDLFEESFNAAEAVQNSLEQGAEVILLFHNTGVLPKALEVIKANGGRLPILSGDSGYKPEMLELHEYTQNIIVVTVPWNLAGNESSAFTQAARNLWKADVSWRTAMTYDATEALVTAMKSSSNREGIQKALSNSSFTANGVAEVVKFQRNTGDRDGSPMLVTVGRNPENPEQYRFIPARGLN